MHLTPHEQDVVLVATIAERARRRRRNGLLLNYPEAVAVLCDAILEAARAGSSFDEVLDAACSTLDNREVLPEVPALLESIQVEALFPDGTKLVTVDQPIPFHGAELDAPGAIQSPDGMIRLNEGRPVTVLQVTNTADRPVWVGSHFPFERTNAALGFDRDAAVGWRLARPAGAVTLFPPGQTVTVELTRRAPAES